MARFYKIGLIVLLFLFCIGEVCATNPDNTNLNNDSFSDNVINNTIINNNNTSTANESIKLNASGDPCGAVSYKGVLADLGINISIDDAIKETNTVNGVTTVKGLTNAFNNRDFYAGAFYNKSADNLESLYNQAYNIIVQLEIDNYFHFGHIKEIRKDCILFNNGLLISFKELGHYFTGILIIINKEDVLNINSFGELVNKSEQVKYTGRLTEKELFNYNFGLVDKSIILNDDYNNFKSKVKDKTALQCVNSIEAYLFGDTLKPKIANLVKIKNRLEPIYNNPNSSPKLINDLNNILNGMQHNLNETISHLEHLINLTKRNIDIDNTNNIESYPYGSLTHNPTVIDVPKLLNVGTIVSNVKNSPLVDTFYNGIKKVEVNELTMN